MSPWNYPFMLTIEPLIDAIAAGNTAVLKPSAYSPATSSVIQKIIKECFPPEYVSVVTGGRAENNCLLAEHFDYIFFTGSPIVGREVMRHASDHLTPVTFRVRRKKSLHRRKNRQSQISCKTHRIWKIFKLRTDLCPQDYIYCDPSIKDLLIAELKKEIEKQFGSQPLTNPNYGKIMNAKHFHRIVSLLEF